MRQVRHLRERVESAERELGRLQRDRDQLVGEFDEVFGGLKLPMRLRRRSGGLLAWRNTARNGAGQRDRDLAQYGRELERLPQLVRDGLRRLEKERILINCHLSLLQHELRVVRQALEKIAANTTGPGPAKSKEHG